MLSPTAAAAEAQQGQAPLGKLDAPAAQAKGGAGGGPFVPVLADLTASRGGGSATSPPGTPAGGGTATRADLGSSASGSGRMAGTGAGTGRSAGGGGGGGTTSPPGTGRTVRFDDERDHITHDSRTSSAVGAGH